MKHRTVTRSGTSGVSSYIQAFLLCEAVLAALFYYGDETYLLALCWSALLIWATYTLSRHKDITLYFDVTIIAIILFVCWMLLTLTWHPAHIYGVVSSWRYAILPFVFIFTVYFIREHDIKIYMYMLLAIGIVVAGISVYQVHALEQVAYGLFPNKNNNAALINLFLLPVISLMLFRQGSWIKLAPVLLAYMLLLYAVILIASRGALLALVICSAGLVILAIAKGKRRNLIILFSATALVLFLTNWLATGESIRTDLQSTQLRWFIFSSTLQMIGDSGLLGAGGGMWRHYYPMYRSIEDTSAGYLVHNDYLQITYELGIIGIASVLAFLVSLTIRCWKLLRLEHDTEKLALYIGLYAAVMSAAIHSMVTFNFYVAAIFLIMGFYSGLIIKRSAQLSPASYRALLVNISDRGMTLVFILMLLIGKSILLPGYADAMSRDLLGTVIPQLAIDEQYSIYKRLITYDPGNAYYPAAAAMTLARSGTGKDQETRKKILHDSRELLHEAASENRFDNSIYVNEAVILSMYSDVLGDDWRAQAIALLAKALEMDPTRVDIRLRLGMMVAAGGDKEKALEILLVRHDHPNNQMMSYYKYGKKLAGELGNSDAERRFNDLIQSYPEDRPQW